MQALATLPDHGAKENQQDDSAKVGTHTSKLQCQEIFLVRKIRLIRTFPWLNAVPDSAEYTFLQRSLHAGL